MSERFSRRPLLHVALIFVDAVLAILGAVHAWPRLLRALLYRWRLSLINVPPQAPWRDLRTVYPRLPEWTP